MKRGYLYLLVTFFFWGSLYVISKFALAYFPPFTLLFLRQFIATCLLGFVAFRKGLKKVPKNHWPYFFGIGLLGYFLSTNLQTLSTSVMNASVAALVISLNPIFISMMASIFLKEKMTKNKLIGMMFSLLGVFAVLGTDTEGANILGILFSLFSVLFWSLNSILVKKASYYYSSEQVTFLGLAFSLPFCFGASFLELQTKSVTFHSIAILSLLFLALFCTATTNLTWNLSLGLLDASVCSLFYPLQSFFATILGIIFLHEKIGLNFIIGSMLITVGVVIGLIKTKPKHKIPYSFGTT